MWFCTWGFEGSDDGSGLPRYLMFARLSIHLPGMGGLLLHHLSVLSIGTHFVEDQDIWWAPISNITDMPRTKRIEVPLETNSEISP
jgi:hypothetical protein